MSYSGAEHAMRMVKTLRVGSFVVLGAYALAMAYRTGVLEKCLTEKVHGQLVRGVDRIKSITEPIGDPKRFATARAHLLKVYGWASSGMVTFVAGMMLFAHQPRIPIAIPIATTLVPFVVLLLPRRLVLPSGRVTSFYTAMLSVGYCFGPIGWVAQDSFPVVMLLTGCTMMGMCLPLFLTRGMVSYVLSSQLLSCALAVSVVTTPTSTHSVSPVATLTQHPSMQILLNADINMVLMLQLVANFSICLLHTVPTIIRFVRWQRTEEELLEEVNPLTEALCICAGWLYVNYRLLRSLCRLLIRKVTAEESVGRDIQQSWNMMGRWSVNVNQVTGVMSGCLMALLYVRAVSLLQRGDPIDTLNHLRKVCARISPLTALIGAKNVRVPA